MSVDPVRRLALEILVQAEAQRPLAPLLERSVSKLPQEASLGFLMELVKGSLRWRGRYDHLIGHFSRRKSPSNHRLMNILRLGMHQLIACNGVPNYAAVDQTVELCRSELGERRVGYVNGVLQALVRHLDDQAILPTEAIRSLFPDPGSDAAGYLSTYQSHPRWLITRWLTRYGFEACEGICQHNNQPAGVTLHVLAPVEPADLMRRLHDAAVAVAAGRSQRALVLQEKLDRPTLTDLLASQPDLLVQDESAQEATAWLAKGAHGRLLDYCAAPGGKTFHLRALWPASDHVVAMDPVRERLALLLQTRKRIEADGVDVLLADGLAPPFRLGCFQAVLVDGPCSGTGVLRHHPEGRWRMRARDLTRFKGRLLTLAREAASLLAPGGRLMYATCSLEPEENVEVVSTLLQTVPDLHPLPLDGVYQRTWLPHVTGSDGFFAARLGKRGTPA